MIKATTKYILIYEKLNEHENLPTLYVAKASALLNIVEIDDAEKILKTIDCSQNIGAQIEVNRLLGRIGELKQDHTSIDTHPKKTNPFDFSSLLKHNFDTLGESGDMIKGLLEQAGGMFTLKRLYRLESKWLKN